ncbi:uncharacterized protein TNCV_984141 [Trichonephila clavipes]|nr:uncharacterized protein TNCV_984141 [Trichonephila clavipes]
MAPGSRCMNGNTCGCRTSWTYRWAVMVPRINTGGDRVLHAMAPHTTTPAVGEVCRYKAKAGLRSSPWGLHTRTRLSSLLQLNLDSSLKMTWLHFATVQFPRTRHHSKRRRRWMGVKGSTRNGWRDPKCPSARHLRMVREDTGPLVKMIPVPVWQPMKQLAVLVHFRQYGGLLEDWSVEGVLTLVFV